MEVSSGEWGGGGVDRNTVTFTPPTRTSSRSSSGPLVSLPFPPHALAADLPQILYGGKFVAGTRLLRGGTTFLRGTLPREDSAPADKCRRGGTESAVVLTLRAEGTPVTDSAPAGKG
jgi:hypothetical protein